ncbi:MAG TPA: hypothetical protein PKE57_07535, partial [Cellvibrionaceae bacterium]|nr:hypothetical protein [Cellvibrionaceae bacterium]
MPRTLMNTAAMLLLTLALPMVAQADRNADENRFDDERNLDHAWSREGGYPSLSVQLGPRPFYLVEDMDASPLKRKLQACALGKAIYKPTQFSIGHRGAALQFPEHTQQSYEAAAKMGTGRRCCALLGRLLGGLF